MSEQRMSHDQARDLAAGYVLDALDPVEEAAVRDHLATCPEAHHEFEVLGSVVPALIVDDALEVVEPPASLGERIMAAAAADLAANPRGASAVPVGAAGTVAAAPSPSAIAFPTAEERARRADRTSLAGPSRTSRFDWALRIAAVIAIVAVGAWTLNLQGQLDRARAFDQAVAAVVQAAGEPGARTVVLAPAEGHAASGIAAVKADGSLVAAMRDLPATSGTQVYTTWVIVPGSDPLSVGDFSADAGGTRSFATKPATTPQGATIAVTLEPNPGNQAPKGPIVSVGVAGPPTGQSG
jgi:hypothetical protein